MSTTDCSKNRFTTLNESQNNNPFMGKNESTGMDTVIQMKYLPAMSIAVLLLRSSFPTLLHCDDLVLLLT